MSTLSRRSLLGLGAAAVLTTGAGCSAGRSGAAGTGLSTSWYGGDPVHSALQTNLAGFGAAHPDLTITSSHAPFGDYWDKLATETAGRTSPDVFRMSMSYFSEYADRGALLDLSAAAGTTIRTAGLDADVLSSGEIDHTMRGIGQSSISHAAFANPQLVHQVGGTLPATWDWAGMAEFATGYAGEAGPGHWGVGDAGGNLQIFEVYARQHGTELFADGALAVAQDVIEGWFDYWERLRRAKSAPSPDVTAESGSFETSTLSKQTTPVVFGWVQQVTFYQPLIKDATVEVLPVPGTTPGSIEGQFLKALDFWCVSATTTSADAAAQLIDYLVNDESAIKATGLTLGVPPSKTARDLLAADQDSAAGRAIAYVEQISSKVGPPPPAWPKGYSELLTGFGRMNENVAFGRSDPARAAAEFVSEAKSALGG